MLPPTGTAVAFVLISNRIAEERVISEACALTKWDQVGPSATDTTEAFGVKVRRGGGG